MPENVLRDEYSRKNSELPQPFQQRQEELRAVVTRLLLLIRDICSRSTDVLQEVASDGSVLTSRPPSFQMLVDSLLKLRMPIGDGDDANNSAISSLSSMQIELGLRVNKEIETLHALLSYINVDAY